MNDERGYDRPATAHSAQGRPQLSVRVHQDDHALEELAHELRELYHRCAVSTPFQSAAWLTAWWRNYGQSGRLRLFAVRRGGRLVGAAPFMLTRRLGMPVLVPLGAPIADYTDILVDSSEQDAVLPALAAAMLSQPGWCAADLGELRRGAVALAMRRLWPRSSWLLPGSPCLELSIGGSPDVHAGMPARTARKVRASLRKIDAAGLLVTGVRPEDAATAARRLLRLHARQWQGRPIEAEHVSARFSGHLEQALPEMIGERQAAIFEYRAEGRLVASDLLVIGRSFVGGYLYGSDPGLRRLVDVTLMLLRQNVMFAHALERPVFGFLRGDEPYKYKWRPRRVPNQRMVLGRLPMAAGYAAAVGGRARAAEWRRNRRHAQRRLRSGAPETHP